MDNDYDNLCEDLADAIRSTETAYCNAHDEDLQVLIGEAQDRLETAYALSNGRSI